MRSRMSNAQIPPFQWMGTGEGLREGRDKRKMEKEENGWFLVW